MEEESEVAMDKSRWAMIALAFLICLLTFRKLFSNPIYRWWRRFEAGFLDGFQVKYNERMHTRKEMLFSRGLGEMTKELGRPLHVLEIGAGTGANFAYYPEGTTVSCLDPEPGYNDRLLNNAGRFPGIRLGQLVVGFAEDMSAIESESVDAVVATLVLCSADDVDRSLKEVIRVLKPVSIMLSLRI